MELLASQKQQLWLQDNKQELQRLIHHLIFENFKLNINTISLIYAHTNVIALQRTLKSRLPTQNGTKQTVATAEFLTHVQRTNQTSTTKSMLRTNLAAIVTSLGLLEAYMHPKQGVVRDLIGSPTNTDYQGLLSHCECVCKSDLVTIFAPELHHSANCIVNLSSTCVTFVISNATARIIENVLHTKHPGCTNFANPLRYSSNYLKAKSVDKDIFDTFIFNVIILELVIFFYKKTARKDLKRDFYYLLVIYIVFGKQGEQEISFKLKFL